jgi:signal peptidase I
MYGMDKEGRDISSELAFAGIEHIPFLKWEGQITLPPHPSLGGIYSPLIVHQMGYPVAVLNASGAHKVQGRMLPLTHIHDALSPPPSDYNELFGFGNFAMARLLKSTEIPSTFDLSTTTEGMLYMELSHHPSLRRLTLVRDMQQRLRPAFDCFLSYIPLDESLLRQLFSALYTSRFVVENGLMHRYGMSKEEGKYISFFPDLTGVPNGTYEFIGGKAYQIGFQGLSRELPLDHPLYTFSPQRTQLFFNLGIECNTLFEPSKGIATLRPARYAYFCRGDFFVMGRKLLSSEEPVLSRFIESEKEKTTRQPNYTGFTDCGPPYKEDGSLDTDLIKRYGLLIPERSYLALGDNHAMSGDSRVFGFENLYVTGG